MKLEEVMKFCHSKQNGQLGIRMETETVPALRSVKSELNGRLTKQTHYSNIKLGIGYGTSIVNRLAASGVTATVKDDIIVGIPDGSDEVRVFEVEAPNGQQWFCYPYILQSIKNPEQYYLRYYQDKSTSATSAFFVDGKYTDKSEIESELRPASVSKKQLEMGVDEDKLVKPFSIKIENIKNLA
jgi:hypothetical protein